MNNIEIEDLWAESLAQKMSDMNHAAFGYNQLRKLSRYEVCKRMKSTDWQGYGAFVDGDLLGFVFVRHNPDKFVESPHELHIQDFSVWPWAQGKGIGSALLEHILNTVGKDRLMSLTVNKNNKAVHLYKKYGFVEVEAPMLIRGTSYIAMVRKNGSFSEADTKELAEAC